MKYENNLRNFKGRNKNGNGKCFVLKVLYIKFEVKGKIGENIFSKCDNGIIFLLDEEILWIYKKNMKIIINSKRYE